MIDQPTPSLATLFAEASMLPTQQWPEFFERRCPDAATRDQLQRLLAADQQADAFFDGLREKLNVPRIKESSKESLADSIAYRVDISVDTNGDVSTEASTNTRIKADAGPAPDSVETFARDQESHQKALPVAVRPLPSHLRAFRWAKSHLGATLAGVLLFALAATALTWSYLTATDARARAKQLVLERDQARSTQQFLLSLFDLGQESGHASATEPALEDPPQATPFTLHELLDRAVQRLESDARESTNPSLHQAIARAYEATGDQTSALRHQRLAYTAVSSQNRLESLEIAIAVARLSLSSGDPKSAAERLRSIVSEASNASHLPGNAVASTSPLALAARQLLAKALLQTRTTETVHEAATILSSVVAVRRQDDALREGLPASLVLLSKALTARSLLSSSQSGPRTPEAYALLKEADTLFQQGIPLGTHNLEALLAVGAFVLGNGEPERAYRIFDALSRGATAIYSAHHPLVARALQGRANSSLEMDHLEAAELDNRRSLQLLAEMGHMDQPAAAVGLTQLGHVLLLRGNLEKSEEFLHRAQLPIHQSTNASLGQSHLYLARIVHLRDGAAKSLRFYQRALGKLSSELVLEENTMIEAQRWLQSARCQAGVQTAGSTPSSADALLQLRALESSPAILAAPGVQRAQTMIDLAACLVIVGQRQEALATVEGAINLFEQRSREEHYDFARAIQLREELVASGR